MCVFWVSHFGLLFIQMKRYASSIGLRTTAAFLLNKYVQWHGLPAAAAAVDVYENRFRRRGSSVCFLGCQKEKERERGGGGVYNNKRNRHTNSLINPQVPVAQARTVNNTLVLVFYECNQRAWTFACLFFSFLFLL